MWKRLQPLSVDYLAKYYEQLTDTTPLINDERMTFKARWEKQGLLAGCFKHAPEDKFDDEPHGVIRMYDNDGNITETTYHDGLPVGFFRWIGRDSVQVAIVQIVKRPNWTSVL